MKPHSGHDPKILKRVFSQVSFIELTPSANQPNVKKKQISWSDVSLKIDTTTNSWREQQKDITKKWCPHPTATSDEPTMTVTCHGYQDSAQSCKCGKKYEGEMSLKVSTRMEQHKKTIRDEKWDLSGISSHSQIYTVGFDWENVLVWVKGTRSLWDPTPGYFTT